MQDIIIKIEDIPTLDEFRNIHNISNITIVGHNWLNDKVTYYDYFECIADVGGNIYYKEGDKTFSIVGVNRRDKLILWVDFTDK